MAEAGTQLSVEKLWDRLVAVRIKGVEEQINELQGDLHVLRNILRDADAMKHTSEIVGHTVKDIKEIIYDAEDIIETFLLKKELGKKSGIRNIVRRFSKRMGPALDLETIRMKISKLMGDIHRNGVVQQIIGDGNYSNPIQERQREMRHTFSNHWESVPVGLVENVKTLVGYLVDEDSIQVVSITGMAGIGKTTLARQVFNHEMVKTHFDGFAWVCISTQYTRKYVWQTILQSLSPDQEVLEMNEVELQEKLFQVLETRKALIVLDDIWKKEDWDRIKPIFPRRKGWKVLLTSRNEGVALEAHQPCFNIKPGFLTLKESWTLLRSIVEYEVDDEMEEIGRHMIKHCGGLPLAIKVLGGLLAVHHTLDDWKRVYENIGSQIVGDANMISYQQVLELSFEELPEYLKLCLLFLAHLPENIAIDVEDMSYYWAAEVILWDDGATIQEVSDEYIEELVKRNMVISERDDDKTSGFRKCRLHNMVREFCQSKAKEEGFLQIVDTNTATSTQNSQSQCKSRRVLFIHSSNHTFDVEEYTQNPSLRSLLFIKHNWGANWKVSDLFFTRLQLMRALDLSGAEFEGDKLSSDIGNLIHLRYLNLYMSKVSHLPSSMQNLRKLVYLNLCVGAIYPICMPNFLKEMGELRYLFLPDDMQDMKKRLELGNLINLETLENFSTKHSSVTDLHCMTRLTTLSIIFNGEGCTMETLSSALGDLKHLEKLTIGNKRVVGVRVKGKVLPLYNKAGSAKKSFCGEKMVCSRGKFLQLKKLYLNGLAKWEKWIIEEGSMPCLQSLSIIGCRQLKEVPDGLKFITSLEELTIMKPGKGFKEKFSRGGKDYYKVQHIRVLIFSEYDMNFSDEEYDDTEFRVYYL